MNIFSILPDVECYKQLHYGDEQLKLRYEDLMLRGDSKAAVWKKPSAEWIEERPVGSTRKEPYKTPDIASLGGDLVLNPKAVSILKPLFSDEAEFLPISVGDEEWALLNITNFQDVFDKANSRYKIRPNGKIGRLLQIAIDKTNFTNSRLFKIVGKRTGWYTDNASGSFKKIVEQHNLTGLKFKELLT